MLVCAKVNNTPIHLKTMRVLTLLIVSCLWLNACDQTEQPRKQRSATPHPVEVVELQHSPLYVHRTIIGTLEAPHTVRIHNEEDGRILQLTVYPGDRISKNKLLLKLDDSLLRTEIDKATATHQQAVQDHERLLKLKPRRLASEEDISRAATAVAQTRAELVLLQTRLARTESRAPFDGIISERLYEPGDIVPLHSHILTIYDPKVLIARVNVSELILPSIELNSKVELRLDALSDIKLNGTVIRKHPIIDASTRQGTLEVRLDSMPQGTYPGQLARIQIKGHTRPLLNLPMHTVRHDTRGEYVYRINDEGKARYTQVKTGIQLGNQIEILSGLNAHDKVISKGFLKLRNNSRVRITNVDTAKHNDTGMNIQEQH